MQCMMQGDEIDIRDENSGDAGAIARLATEAFKPVAHSSHTEAAIVAALRSAGALTISLVAEQSGRILGHVAFSPVTIDGLSCGWFGLGPVAVLPSEQRKGIGTMLVKAGLDRLAARGAKGCVVLGDPHFYGRFGFRSDPDLQLGGVPPRHFQRLDFTPQRCTGSVKYHSAFDDC